ncbi:hypothetical protein C8F01DRAFT_1089745 [Mycena amicta]|nr:hypothetical protein C8F01DRAFT_1089745 [Mycena amicta]
MEEIDVDAALACGRSRGAGLDEKRVLIPHTGCVTEIKEPKVSLALEGRGRTPSTAYSRRRLSENAAAASRRTRGGIDGQVQFGSGSGTFLLNAEPEPDLNARSGSRRSGSAFGPRPNAGRDQRVDAPGFARNSLQPKRITIYRVGKRYAGHLLAGTRVTGPGVPPPV